jgi:hypothetical protein
MVQIAVVAEYRGNFDCPVRGLLADESESPLQPEGSEKLLVSNSLAG